MKYEILKTLTPTLDRIIQSQRATGIYRRQFIFRDFWYLPYYVLCIQKHLFLCTNDTQKSSQMQVAKYIKLNPLNSDLQSTSSEKQ